jgi:hypothetical protein
MQTLLMNSANISPTVAKSIKSLKGSDKAAHAAVGEYVQRYMSNRGLVASFPRLGVGCMADLAGWPVFNADQSFGSIAHFSTREKAQASVVAWDQATR